MKEIQVLISGEVQGVGFRFFVRQQARRQGLAGFARNLADGRVEVVVQGEEPVLQDFLAELKKGPPSAKIVDVAVFFRPAAKNYDRFEVC